MSRIGRRPIEIPEDVDVSLSDNELSVAGENGELVRDIPDSVSVAVDDDTITVEPASNQRHDQAMWGTMASHIKNMVIGVTEGYEKVLTYKGIGYQASVSGDQLHLEMGYSHDVDLDIPDSVSVETESNRIIVSGPNKDVVGQFAASIRAVREPEPYKGAGIQYEDETIRRKEGKTAV